VNVFEYRPIHAPKEFEPTPLLLVPGLGMHAHPYFKTATELGHTTPVFLIDSPHGTDFVDPKIQGTSLPSLERRASAIAEALRHVGLTKTKIDIIGHSQGACAGAVYADAYPEQVRNYLALAPAGITTSDSVSVENALLDFPLHMAALTKLTIDGIPYTHAFMTDTILRSFTDLFSAFFPTHKKRGHVSFEPAYESIVDTTSAVNEIARANIVPTLVKLQKHGINVQIIGHTHDTLFPSDKMREVADKSHISYTELPGDHISILQHGADIHAIQALRQKSV
jgi:pimeloyl-ACP methyl ester carboxylesterase